MRLRSISLTVLLLFGWASVEAQIPLGAEFRVDTQGAAAYTLPPYFQANAAVAPNGRFVVAWTALPTSPVKDQVARRFDAGGRAIGVEFLVNSYTTGRQGGGSVAMDEAGNFVVIWASEGQDGSGYGIFGQRFAASGARLGTEFRVNETTPSSQVGPAVAMRRDGGFVVAWRDTEIVARRYQASGAPIGGEFQVNTVLGPGSTPSVDFDDAGNFVVIWSKAVSGPFQLRGQLFSANGVPLGGEFIVSPGNTSGHRVARSANGSFVVAWYGGSPADPDIGVLAQRFDAVGAPIGAEFLVNSYTTGEQRQPDVAIDADGDFVVAWQHGWGIGAGIFARRFDAAGAPTGPEFRVDAATTGDQTFPSVASDHAGNFVVTWHARPNGDVVLARRYAGGLLGAALAVDLPAGPTSDGNGVLEAGETVRVDPAWLNANASAQTFTATASAFTGPGTSGNPTYSIADATAAYATVPAGATASCTATGDCYALGISIPNPRPAQHWDASFREEIAPASLGGLKDWALHVGDSFADVPRSNIFYRFVETLLHHGVTGGCTATTYCPALSTTREQMAVFVLVAKEGAGYQPPACATPQFLDVPANSPFCPWIEELARRGVVAGCGGGNYCPAAPVSRQEMAVFVLATKEPGTQPPACGGPMFTDVPATSPFCRWVEELARRGVVTGCGGGAYCPTSPVTREQMGVFLSVTFGLSLYGP